MSHRPLNSGIRPAAPVVQAPRSVVCKVAAKGKSTPTPATPAKKADAPAPAAKGVDVTETIKDRAAFLFGRTGDLSTRDKYLGMSWTVREDLIQRFNATQKYWKDNDVKRVFYLSAEFLMGRSLINTVYNLGLEGRYAEALNKLGVDMEEIASEERDASLGNGGLGRLAACFLDSIATLDIPGWGYGIRYKFGMFKQAVDKGGYQTELPDIWLQDGNPWEIKTNIKHEVGFGGKVEKKDGKTVWVPSEKVWAVAYDNPIPGFQTPTTSNLRLWDCVPKSEFDLSSFNAGDYDLAMLERQRAESISAVLYPNDATPEGKELRLKQQYFFVAASIADVMADFKAKHGTNFSLLPTKACFQMNDTHPTIAVAELMRVLIDEEGLPYDEAWAITTKTLNYTNHTVMPEALEKWPVKVMNKMLPRHMQIIDQINAAWVSWLQSNYDGPDKAAKINAMKIVSPNQWNPDEMLVNMAYLACVGSKAINGVAAIHSEIIKTDVFPELYEVMPSKFQNKTNGVTTRRWLAWCNPPLAALITETLGDDSWINDASQLAKLRDLASDAAFQAKWKAVKQDRKAKLAAMIKKIHGDDIPLNAMFDIQIKRIHEYKRQLMNVLSIIWRYKQLKKMSPEERKKAVPRVCMIGGKAASAYDMAKRIVRLVTAVGAKINNDPETKDLLRLYFIPDYNVTAAETLIPAAELSQHISTAGTEASGTSNMKFQMNGCLIIGTLDGANIEIAEETGIEELFVFGIKADELNHLRATRKAFKHDPRFDELMQDISNGFVGDAEYFKPMVDSISNMNVGNDWFLVANDFASYLDAQEKVDECYKDQAEWTRRSIMYTAGSGKFSSDRTIREYAEDIWDVKPARPQ